MTNLASVLAFGLCVGIASSIQLKPGDTFTATCRLPYNPDQGLYQIYRGEHKVKLFSSTTTVQPMYISNDTTVYPSFQNFTNRYSVSVESSRLALRIENVMAGDAGPWFCRQLVDTGASSPSMFISEMEELVIEGEILGLYWTTNRSAPSALENNPSIAEADGATVEIEQSAFGEYNLFCVLILTISEPQINMSFGRYNMRGSNSVDWKEHGSFSHIVLNTGGYVSSDRTALRVAPKFNQKPEYDESRPLYCRAELPSTILQKSIKIRIKRSPGYDKCEEYTHYALRDQKKVVLQCQFFIYPPPTMVTWRLPDDTRMNATSSLPRFDVEDKLFDNGTYRTTITITDVERSDFGVYRVGLTNEKGNGSRNFLLFVKSTSHAARNTGSAYLMIMFGILLFFIPKY